MMVHSTNPSILEFGKLDEAWSCARSTIWPLSSIWIRTAWCPTFALTLR